MGPAHGLFLYAKNFLIAIGILRLFSLDRHNGFIVKCILYYYIL